MVKVGQCKALARETLKGKYGTVIGAEILMFIIALLLGAAAVGSLVVAIMYGGSDNSGSGLAVIIAGSCLFTIFLFLFFFFLVYMNLGFRKLILNICSGKKYGVGDIFYGFKSGSHVGRVFWIGVIIYLIMVVFHALSASIMSLYARSGAGAALHEIIVYLGIGFLLWLLMLVIVTGYFVCGLVVLDDPSFGMRAAFRESRRLMKGSKLKAFWFNTLSFLFWNILMWLCPPAILWISPYILASKAIFFLSIKGELDKVPCVAADAADRDIAASSGEAAGETSGETARSADASGKGPSFEDAAAEAGVSIAAGTGQEVSAAEVSAETEIPDASETGSAIDETPGARDEAEASGEAPASRDTAEEEITEETTPAAGETSEAPADSSETPDETSGAPLETSGEQADSPEGVGRQSFGEEETPAGSVDFVNSEAPAEGDFHEEEREI